jgi:hypothetical protein
MGDTVSRATVLDSLLRRMLVAAFGMLDATDREAVCGDLAESRETTVPALREVLSLVLRRRTASLGNWHPWLTLAALTIPLAAFVSLTARSTADGSAIYLCLYLNNWDWTYTKSLGFWQELIQCAQGVLLSCVALVCWSWTSGLLLGWSARRTLWLQGAVFFAVVVTVGAHGVPLSFGHVLVLQRARNYQGNAAVFAQASIGRFFPGFYEILFVTLPAWKGMRQSFRINQLPRSGRMILLTFSVAAAGTLVIQNLAWWQMRVWHIWPLRLPRLPLLMLLAIAAPAAYLLLTPVFRWTSQRLG